jgi:hypothetical protein
VILFDRWVERNPDWTPRDNTLVTWASILLAIDSLLLFSRAILHRSFSPLVVFVLYVVVVLAALWSGLPRVVVENASDPLEGESVYRSQPAVEVIKPPPPSFTFMRVVLVMIVGAHRLAAVATLVISAPLLIVIGLASYSCSKH